VLSALIHLFNYIDTGSPLTGLLVCESIKSAAKMYSITNNFKGKVVQSWHIIPINPWLSMGLRARTQPPNITAHMNRTLLLSIGGTIVTHLQQFLSYCLH
jgi:hypothetical protein